MCRNCQDERSGPCVCDKHAAQIRERDARYHASMEEVRYWLRSYASAIRGNGAGSRLASEQLERLGVTP